MRSTSNMEQVRLLKGDNRELLKTLEDNSVDSVVTDPPYALTSIKNRFGKPGSAEAQYGTDGAFQRASKGFMGKEWDSEVPSVEVWKEVLRVLKPGGHILAFGGTRTYHHLVMNMEMAGLEIRDSISYMYGSGFPKSHNIGKAIDKIQGNEREVVGVKENKINLNATKEGDKSFYENAWNNKEYIDLEVTKGQSDWEGWGTSLKPSMELICMARKPLSEKSIAENVLTHGTGGINIDASRVGSEVRTTPIHSDDVKDDNTLFGLHKTIQHERVETTEGRFPANTIMECICDEVIPGDAGEKSKKVQKGSRSYGFMNVSVGDGWESNVYKDTGDTHTNPECPCYILDQQSGISKPSKGRTAIKGGSPIHQSKMRVDVEGHWPADNGGGASRFFYTAKVSKKERNMGLDDFEEKVNKFGNQKNGEDLGNGSVNDKFTTQPRKNSHPTVKPTNLMTYLCRLITPPNGVVLDMYMGSGSTGVSALLEGFNFIGMEMDEEYFNIAEARINNYEQYREFKKW